ncbi:ATP-binding protein [Flavobacterium aquidurense]|uniref:sensor histidine kinase n=1 Tax=Flavobacterium aquidurense TaxID=362413 RepID=UPI003756B29F
MAKYKRIKGGEKNELSGQPFTKQELKKVGELYIEINGQGIHENNPKIHILATNLGRTIRSVENQLLGFRSFVTVKSGRKNYNTLIPKIWSELNEELIKSKKDSKNLTEKKLPFDEFKFRISSQLKTILGKNLITDDSVAIFELVKNSFDAHANNVKIFFEEDKIIIWDDGKGMDRRDLIDKWLFIAYSAKNEGIEDIEFNDEKYKSYRDKINPDRTYAGAKGIGRFSADRLGSQLDLTTRKINDSIYWKLGFNWDEYEINANDEFKDIDIRYEELSNVPFENFQHGLILEISNLRTVWPRTKILELKSSLEKLINPFTLENEFNIEIICEREKEYDLEIQKSNDFKRWKIVNGSVKNFVFDTLNINTTQIRTTVVIEEDEQEYIITELIDRSNLIYKIKEPNKYNYIPFESNIHLYYLNQSAKANFTKMMGIRAFDFGSVFLFNNGFRVLPFGEPNNDPFDINQRKAQGYSRYLGTRDLIGQVSISESSEQFQETSSRDGGLIETSGTNELHDFFIDTLEKLESYVEPILWKIKKRTGDSEETLDLTAKNQIFDFVEQITGKNNIKLLDYSDKLLSYITENVNGENPTFFDRLRTIAKLSGDERDLLAIDVEEKKNKLERKRNDLDQVRAFAEEVKRKEAEAKAFAEEAKRKEAEAKAFAEEAKRKEAEAETLKKVEQLAIRDSIESQDLENVTNLHHQVFVISDTVSTILKEIHNKISIDKKIDFDELNQFIDELTLENNKIESLSRFGMRAIFEDFNSINENSIVNFIDDYVNKISNFFKTSKIKVEFLSSDNKDFKTMFRPLDVSIIIDNMINNAKKHNATNLLISTSIKDDNTFEIVFSDNGKGLNSEIKEVKEVFKKGFSTTKSTGLGLYHVSNIINDYKWEINVNSEVNQGIEFIIKINI